MITRRRLLAILPATAASLHAQAHIFTRKPKPKPALPLPLVYFGTDTLKAAAKGIYLSRFDPATGHLTDPILAAPTVRPTYLALNRIRVGPSATKTHPQQERRLLYAVNAGPDANSSMLSAYTLDPASGDLHLLNQVSSAGAGPCYVSVDPTGAFAFCANYNGGTIATYNVQPDGSLSSPIDQVDFHAASFGRHGPSQPRQDGPHPHSTLLSPDSHFLLVNDLGLDIIAAFPVRANSAHLGRPTLNHVRTSGSGPRHLAFHPNGRWAYSIDELASRIDQYLWNTTRPLGSNEAEGLLTDVGRSVSTLDTAFHAPNTAAEIVIAPTGNFLYASNRGEDSLVVFAIHPGNGGLSFLQRISCGGRSPRHFTLDPTSRYLLCGNQESASVTVFRRDPASGRVTGPIQTMPLESPVFTLFA